MPITIVLQEMSSRQRRQSHSYQNALDQIKNAVAQIRNLPDGAEEPQISLVDRNEIVALSFKSGGLAILTEGRALARGGVGDRIRVMNLASRTTVTGTITRPGEVEVRP